MRVDLSKIKKIYKTLPPELFKPLCYLPFSIFCGPSYRKTMYLQNEFSKLTPEIKKVYADNLLVENLNEAIKYVPFYKDFAKTKSISIIESAEQLYDFPIICKDMLSSDLSWFIDNRYKKNSYKVSTGGTTGKQTEFLMSNSLYGIEWAFVNYYLNREGIDVNSKRLCLRGVEGIPVNDLLAYNYLYKELLISPFKLTAKAFSDNYKKILNYNASWIHGYPSSVAELARIVLDLGVCLDSIKHILLVSESATSSQLEIINKAFRAKVVTFYGMSERVVFAPYNSGNYEPNPLYGYTEVLNYEIVGTGFWNKATRLVRYKTGDTLDINESSNLIKFSQLSGRWGKDYLIGKDGQKITMTSLNIHSDVLNRVRKYQFFQSEVGCCTLRLQVEGSFNKEVDPYLICLAFQNKVGSSLDISYQLVDDIPLTIRGKHRFIVNDLLMG
ncbi:MULTISPECIES: hypothetical protein [Marinomonas]|uniref:Phenylacetate-CoA ligase n=1 Tax=Marinomonas rhodophyticola TaxID=2992803 RepID=A0ABT3KKR1_9GAMM|nr:hypothetical protein [Marinomonas sp. KJ51-3]MCW4631009.1 hypothetical protein [Marinomonas sp. KJ51-3]